MKCYKCGNHLADGNTCQKCGADVSVYKVVVKASNAYYNLGLAKARIRDLTGAVESLKTSLVINKNNVKARNLLGLIYCEMGNVVEALSEWVISKNQKPEKNIASSYLTKVQSNQGKFESVIQTVKKYNQSLRYAQEGSYDLAVIQLKKVTAQNPKLIKAQLLLALMYMREKEYAKAKKNISSVLKTDRNNILATEYLKKIEVEENTEAKDVSGNYLPKKRVKGQETVVLSGNDVILPATSYKEPSNGAITVINILAGVVVGAALIWFLIMPARYKGLTADHNASILEYSEKLSTSNVELNSLTRQLDEIKAERDTLTKRLEDITGTDGNNRLLTAVINAADAYIADNKIQAAEFLVDIDVSGLPTDTAKSLYNKVAAGAMNTAAADLYNQGYNSYLRAGYEEAASLFVRSYRLNNTKEDTAYYCAKSYAALNRVEEAKIYFQYIVKDFPASRYFGEANTYVTTR